MFKKIRIILGIILVLFSAVEASEPFPLKVKGLKGSPAAFDVDGTVYMEPSFLEKGGKWKILWENDHLYIIPEGLTGGEKVEIPFRIANGTPCVDFSYFGEPAGFSYSYKKEKQKISVKRINPEKKNRGKKKNSDSSMPLILWDPGHLYTAERAGFKKTSGLRILSPDWGCYDSLNTSVPLKNFPYLQTAKDSEMAVMPLIHNDFAPRATSSFLQDERKQDEWISRMASAARAYGLYGYNIDFENMNPRDKDRFTALVKKLSEALHKDGKVLTVDITVYNESSPYWSLCYDRKALARFCDYEIVMGYDETPRISKYAGSVSSWNWLDQNLNQLLTMIPAEKLILGLPFYTRIYAGNGGYVKSRVLEMKDQDSLIRRYHLKPVWRQGQKQFVAEWKQNGYPQKVWLEETRSLVAKVSLVGKYGLGGLAFWRYGFEMPSIYDSIERALENPKTIEEAADSKNAQALPGGGLPGPNAGEK